MLLRVRTLSCVPTTSKPFPTAKTERRVLSVVSRSRLLVRSSGLLPFLIITIQQTDNYQHSWKGDDIWVQSRTYSNSILWEGGWNRICGCVSLLPIVRDSFGVGLLLFLLETKKEREKERKKQTNERQLKQKPLLAFVIGKWWCLVSLLSSGFGSKKYKKKEREWEKSKE